MNGALPTVESMLDDVLQNAIFDGMPALSWLEQGLCVDDATASMEKPELLKLVSKAVLSIVILNKEQIKEIEGAIKANKLAKYATQAALVKYEAVEKMVKTNMAKQGGIGKKAKYQPLKELAGKLVIEKNFSSRRSAAITIKPEILKIAKELAIPLSEMQAESTITKWLKEMGLPANISL